MNDHCRRQLHTFHPGPTAAQVVTVCGYCQAETHTGDVVPEHTRDCPRHPWHGVSKHGGTGAGRPS